MMLQTETVEETRARQLYEVMRKQRSFIKEYPNIAAASWDEVTEKVRCWYRLISKPLTGAKI